MLYKYRGKVKEGKKRGRTLGYPTANIRLHKKIPEGVYAAIVFIKGIKHFSATFIGSSKTFEEHDYKSESFILDFNKQIYNHWITVKLIKKIRGNKKFSSKKELIDEIKNDIEKVQNLIK